MQAARALQAFVHVDPNAEDTSDEARMLSTVGALLLFEGIYQLRRQAGGDGLQIKIVR